MTKLYYFVYIRALLEEGKPKDVRSDLRRDADTHWNLILPQIICIIVVLKVLKLPRECSLEHLYPTQINETREGHESNFVHIKDIS